MQKSRCSIAFKNAEVVSLRGAKRRRHLWHREMRARERERERERVARVTSRFEEVENRRNARQKFNRTQKRARLLEDQARTDCRGRGSLSLSLSLSLSQEVIRRMRVRMRVRGKAASKLPERKDSAFSGSSGKYLGRAERAREKVRVRQRAPQGRERARRMERAARGNESLVSGRVLPRRIPP